MTDNTPSKPRGFAALKLKNPDQLRDIQSAAGKRAHETGAAHEFDSTEAAAAGHIGGTKVSQDREHMREIARRGGTAASRNRDSMRERGRKGGSAPHVNRTPKGNTSDGSTD